MQRLHGHLWVHSNKEIEWGDSLGAHDITPPPHTLNLWQWSLEKLEE